jgi:hypothetical protein
MVGVALSACAFPHRLKTLPEARTQTRASDSSVYVFSGDSGKQVLPVRCLVCGCSLSELNRSSILNVCCFCQHILES